MKTSLPGMQSWGSEPSRVCTQAEEKGVCRILIIDDTRAIHEDFHKILVQEESRALDEADAVLFGDRFPDAGRGRFVLDSAYQGEEAIELARRARAQNRAYAVVFLDMRMPPGWDGVETAQKLWAVDPALQIVLCSAYSDYSWIDITRQLKATDNLLILKKPFDNIEVLQLAHALAKKWTLAGQSKRRLEELDRLVDARTVQLRVANAELVQEVAERKLAEERVLRLNRLYSVLSKINELTAHARSREAFCIEACRIAVEDGKLTDAWVGMVEEGTSAIKPIAHSGIAREYVETLRLSAATECPEGHGPTGTAIRTGRYDIRHDLEKDARLSPWRDLFARLGFRSMAAFPLKVKGRTVGALTLCTSEPQFFKEQEIMLLDRLAVDLSFGMGFLEQEQQLQLQGAALEAAANSIVITTADGIIRWHNAAFTRLTGYTAQEVIGKSVGLLRSGKHDAAFYEAMWKRIKSGCVWYGELINRRKDGSLYSEEMTITPVLDENRNITNFIAIKQDITQRRELEQQLRQSQKMEAIGQLAGGVAHDFNNLLAVMRGNTELVLLEPEQVTELARECLSQVIAAADRAANLTRQLLAFGRKQVMQSEPTNLNVVIGNLAKMLKRLIGENIQLECLCAERLPFVQADVGMIEQVLVNLILNARDAMPGGGKLSVRTGTVVVDETHARTHPEGRPGAFVWFQITDTGTGIVPENLSRIFEPFFTTKPIGKGTGLGLATVYGIVKQHAGWVEVDSKVGAGSSFKILLPKIDPPEPDFPEGQSTGRLQGGRERILLVEDDEAVRSFTRRLLEKFGYHVTAAGSGSNALEIWGEHGGKIDLLLTDIVMPGGINGRELAESLKTQCPALKVMLMSGYSEELAGKDTAFIRRTGAHFIQKPCPPRELLEVIRRYLDQP